MGYHTIVTWAVPVYTAPLGARLESYVESKAVIHTLRLCVQHAQAGQTLGKLPVEIVEITARLIRQSYFEDRIDGWWRADACCKADCSPSDHLTKSEFEQLRDDFYGRMADWEDESAKSEAFMEILEDNDGEGPSCYHDDERHDLLCKVGVLDPSEPTAAATTFKKCRKVCGH